MYVFSTFGYVRIVSKNSRPNILQRRSALPLLPDKFLAQVSQSGCANLIDVHASSQSPPGCNLDSGASIVDIFSCEMWKR